MLSGSAASPVETRCRAALLSHLEDKLRGGFPGERLASALAPLAIDEIARALRPDPAETMHALSDALLTKACAAHPESAIVDLVLDAHPRMDQRERTRLAAFVLAVRDLAREHDGVVEDRYLRSAGFGHAEQTRYMPMAERLIATLDGRIAVVDGEHNSDPIARLKAAHLAAGRRADARDLAVA